MDRLKRGFKAYSRIKHKYTSQAAPDNTNCIKFLWCMKNSAPDIVPKAIIYFTCPTYLSALCVPTRNKINRICLSIGCVLFFNATGSIRSIGELIHFKNTDSPKRSWTNFFIPAE